MSAESSKKASKGTIQATLNFPISFIKNKKEKSKEKNTENNKLQQTTQQTLLNFLPANNPIKNTKKRILDDIVSSESENEEDESDSSESEYELHDDLVNYSPNICDEEKKLRRNKFFLRLISPKLVRCQCEKEIKLDRVYRAKNLISHAKRNKYQMKTDKQVSVLKYFSELSNKDSQNKAKTKACIGLIRTPETYI
ncbi:hypothetical protein GLOIN_2v1783228 [Rhizophagus clarus]|uniref:Uncharacterized protein n=1 Tax=Rhizophagus clarus TaxID=94130 RepID=A0A8H3MF41_9GLOM|nr:hypothetical protein GLOIN_2v1783228 [Rhizophagus clarus]